MYRIKKISIILIVFVGLIFAQQPKSLIQVVRNWPADYDTTGVHWFTYDLADPENRVNNETSNNCYTTHNPVLNLIAWTSDIANFGSSPSWAPGDSIVALGSWDSAYVSDPGGYGENPNHCGFYWLFSDTLTTVDPQVWQPDDALRPLPQPIAAQVGTNIEITIPNPDETRRVDQNKYDVLGYWFWADTLGSGKPDSFNVELAFVPVQGGLGETTLYIHPISGNYREGQTVLWAYFLVAAPDTGGSTCPGYSAYYMSRNSNPIVIIGIEETNELRPESKTAFLKVNPNPFRQNTRISYKTQYSGEAMGLRIYDVGGKLIKSFDTSANNESTLRWDGSDDEEQRIPEGVYFIRLESPDMTITRKIIKLE